MVTFPASSSKTTVTSVSSFVSHLQCSDSSCGSVYAPDQIQTYCCCGKPLRVEYDIRPLDRSVLQHRPTNMWRYREMLPILHDEHIISLGEGMTPLLSLPRISRQLGIEKLWLKDESQNPTGSFKARGLSMAISKAYELGIRSMVIPTAGNAGGAMSAYCARAGMEAHVYMPVETPEVFRMECLYMGAEVTEVEGTISDCGKRARAEKDPEFWFDVSTLKEPYRIEGKKTMGYEIAEQLLWEVPDVVIYPTGGGTGLIGIWKAFDEMEALGWIGKKRPRMVAVQAAGCAPLVDAFHAGKSKCDFAEHAHTLANGLRVPKSFGDEWLLRILRESQGTAVAISDEHILEGVKDAAEQEGIFMAPEGGAVWAALHQLVSEDWIKPDEQVVLLNTGSAYKYMENMMLD